MEPEHEDNDVPLPTECEVEELQMLESLIATTQKKVEEMKKRITRSGPTMRSFTCQEEQVRVLYLAPPISGGLHWTPGQFGGLQVDSRYNLFWW